MIKVWPQSWFVIKYLRAVFENVHISISIPFHSLNIWEKGFWKCTHSVLSFIVGNISVDFCSSLKIPLTFQSTVFLKLHCLLWFHWIIALLFICFIHYSFACVWRDRDPKKWVENSPNCLGTERKVGLSLCTERVGLYLGTIGTLEMHFPIIICQATCRLHPEICKRCWTNMEDKYRANMERQFAKLLRKRGANAAWCTIITQQGATIPDICKFLDTTSLYRLVKSTPKSA